MPKLEATTADGANWIPALAALPVGFLMVGIGGILDRLVKIESHLRPALATGEVEPAAPKIGLLLNRWYMDLHPPDIYSRDASFPRQRSSRPDSLGRARIFEGQRISRTRPLPRLHPQEWEASRALQPSRTGDVAEEARAPKRLNSSSRAGNISRRLRFGGCPHPCPHPPLFRGAKYLILRRPGADIGPKLQNSSRRRGPNFQPGCTSRTHAESTA